MELVNPNNFFFLLTHVDRSPLPKNPVSALRGPNWKLAMDDEFTALIKNETWELGCGLSSSHYIIHFPSEVHYDPPWFRIYNDRLRIIALFFGHCCDPSCRWIIFIST